MSETRALGVDEAIDSVIDSFCLTKGKKKSGLIQKNEK